MANINSKVNKEVTEFLDALKHPLRNEIDFLRKCILSAHNNLSETIKWNGPNYSSANEDRITMKILPPKNIQLIFHRGAKKLEQPKNALISTKSKLLVWKENDRAIVTFNNLQEIQSSQTELVEIVKAWIKAST